MNKLVIFVLGFFLISRVCAVCSEPNAANYLVCEDWGSEIPPTSLINSNCPADCDLCPSLSNITTIQDVLNSYQKYKRNEMSIRDFLEKLRKFIKSNLNLADAQAPIRTNRQPTGTLPAGTTSVILNLTTNENAVCRYSKSSGVSYSSMTGTFTTIGGSIHSTTITGLQNGQTYNYYIRCNDSYGNINADDYVVSFNVDNFKKKYIGIIGFDNFSYFYDAVHLKPSAVSLSGPVSASELQLALNTAKSLNFSLAGRVEGRSRFVNQTNNKINFDLFRNLISNVFFGNGIANDPNFLFYYIIDEPCDTSQWNITLDDLKQVYSIVKSVNPNISVMINFGDLRCLDNFIPSNCENWKISDVASFVTTIRKTNDNPNYIQSQSQYIDRIKNCDPNIKIINIIAVYEYPFMGMQIPSAQWINLTGMQTIDYGFDGIMYFKWNASSYMGDTIEDVRNNQSYINAFNSVFERARQVL